MSPPQGFKSLPLPLAQLSLAAVLKCGQSFRWTSYPLKVAAPPETVDLKLNNQPTHEYRLVLRDRVICLRQTVDTLFYRALFPEDAISIPEDEMEARDKQTLAWLRDYFQLDTDLVKLYSEWSEKDRVFRETVKDRFPGIRMLRQDPWENVVSFICSSNNHIGRITKMVQSLCTAFSSELCSLSTPNDGEEAFTTASYHPFPTPKQLAGEEVSAKLRELGFGYRAEYVQRTAQMLCEEHEDPEAYLKSLRDLPVDEARTELLKLCGVGPKVADCILLMSLDKKAVVPVDTHVHQIALKYYGLKGTPQGKGGKVPMTPKIYEVVAAKLTQTWGEYAGWAHSVLFTADLRSFADYGLETPSSTPIKSPATPVPPTPSEAGSDYFGASPVKRRRSETKTQPRAKRVKTK